MSEATTDPGEAREPAGPAGGEPLRRLDPRAIAVWRVGLLVRTALIAAAVAGFQLVTGITLAVPDWAPTAGVLVVGFALASLLPARRWEAWGYQVGEEALYLTRGVLWRTASTVPLGRIQHVDTRRGPVERWLGLARVVVFTAGYRGAELPIPGLDTATAEALRDRLVALSGKGDAV